MLESIRWHGASSFAILNGIHIYINPRRIVRPDRPADVILIGSGHYDHCSESDIDKLRGEHTCVITSESAVGHVQGNVVLRPWQSSAVGSAGIKGVPLFRADGTPDLSGDLGFVISTSRYDIYYTGRTEALPESFALRPDIVILPISGDRAISDAAARALRGMQARWIVPYGWDINGTTRTGIAAAQVFAGAFSADQVVILDPTP
ncbi:MAG: MBL fold metallo-hydrolase [Chloroflexota bacterium]|nr:MBL fold metallo-hydrolase [Chloroflexota bacterium]